MNVRSRTPDRRAPCSLPVPTVCRIPRAIGGRRILVGCSLCVPNTTNLEPRSALVPAPCDPYTLGLAFRGGIAPRRVGRAIRFRVNGRWPFTRPESQPGWCSCCILAQTMLLFLSFNGVALELLILHSRVNDEGIYSITRVHLRCSTCARPHREGFELP